MSWFKRIKEGITTSTKDKKETPEGLWYKCPSCKAIITSEDHASNLFVCNSCEHHHKIGSDEYFEIFLCLRKKDHSLSINCKDSFNK